MAELVVLREEGLYCPQGAFYIDPWRPVERAVITHAHSDHARTGSRAYLAAEPSEHVLRSRLGDISLELLPYGRLISMGDVLVSLHPAGHVLGSAQVRIEHGGEVWVVSGDYKTQGAGLDPIHETPSDTDPTCAPFEPVTCDTFITESTFGLPIYRWPAQQTVFAEINGWWQENAKNGLASILYCYSFGKAQRILAGLDESIGPIICHGAVENLNEAYRQTGVRLPLTHRADGLSRDDMLGAMVLAPPSSAGTPWLRRFGEHSDAFASGWMRVRGSRRRRGVDRGFVLSDHADWPGLLAAIAATSAGRVIVTHGQGDVLVRWLLEKGLDAHQFQTAYGDDEALEGTGAASQAEQ